MARGGKKGVSLENWEAQTKIGNGWVNRRQRRERLGYDKYDTSRAKIVLAIVGAAIIALILWLDYRGY